MRPLLVKLDSIVGNKSLLTTDVKESLIVLTSLQNIDVQKAQLNGHF